MIASDLNNPEFVGAVNPDSRLAVRFYSRAVKQDFESEAQGRPIFKDVDYITIFVPGDNTTVHDTPVREDHKARFPIQWAHYMNKHGGDTKEVGTPLAQWPRITPAQAEELRALKFYTVENVANASDQNIQRIGMLAGMNPFQFRDHAMRFLQLAQGDSVTAATEEKLKAAEERNKALEDRMASLEAMLAAQQSAGEQEKRGPGRPRKEA